MCRLVVALVLGVCLATSPRFRRAQLERAASMPPEPRRTLDSSSDCEAVSVMDFGAVPDGRTDNTAAFQAALDSLGPLGGIVWAPPGLYAFNGSVEVPIAVTLEGSYRVVPSHSVGQGGLTPTDGTVLMPRGGRGNESEPPFITLNTDSTLRGFVVYHVDVSPTTAPVPYPWAISMTGNNPAVLDVELLNAYNGILAVGAGRHYIARVQGQPTNIGVYIDETYDIGRVENVHFNPWFSDNKEYMAHQLVEGRAFVIGRSDWEYFFNTFVFGMSIGYHFVKTETGSCNGNFLGIGADMAANASVVVESADPWGILITNGEFTSFVDSGFGIQYADSTQVVVNATNSGAVRFVNSAFWGPSNQIAQLYGTGTTGFTACTFSAWDAHKQGNPAIKVFSGNVIIQGCEFQQNDNQVELAAGVNKVVIVGNIVSGAVRIVDHGAKNPQVGYNAGD